MKRLRLIAATVALCVTGLATSGCMAKKVVTVPLRVTGAVASVVPLVGDPIDKTLDATADVID